MCYGQGHIGSAGDRAQGRGPAFHVHTQGENHHGISSTSSQGVHQEHSPSLGLMGTQHSKSWVLCSSTQHSPISPIALRL